MPSVSKLELSEKLHQSWKFLSGSELTFRELKSAMRSPDHHYLSVMIPIGASQQEPSNGIAIGLLISEEQAARVASYMFDVDINNLTKEDIADACKETCNVLGGALSFDDENKLGIPKTVSQEHFTELQDTSAFTVTFASNAPYEGHVVLTILFLTTHMLLNEI